MLRPPPLKRGDVVRIVAPSSPFDPELFEKGLAVLRDRFGLLPRMRSDVTACDGYLAGDDARRLAEWHEAASDGEARAIWCARGGYGAMRLLPKLEAGRLFHPPKVVVGFSDITAIHVALNRAGLVTVHGPVVTQLPRLGEASLDHLEALLFGGAPSAGDRRSPVPPPGRGVLAGAAIRAGVASGPLLGGSLTVLSHLCGTAWQPRFAGAVVFLEDVGERPYRLDRTLTQLRLAGAFDRVAAVCLGQFTQCDDPDLSGIEVARRAAWELNVPAIEGVPAGHEDPNLALPMGSIVNVVAPRHPEEGPPRISFEQGATA
ncbi:MAG TPA: LD-carboxypeptidase [Anaeromyxobacteraceae bacterium]|nr:LD-carboxypeptidase [Anaeromyxobacteraceae bacterium]